MQWGQSYFYTLFLKNSATRIGGALVVIANRNFSCHWICIENHKSSLSLLLEDPEIKIGEATEICSARFNSKKMINEFQQVPESLATKSLADHHK